MRKLFQLEITYEYSKYIYDLGVYRPDIISKTLYSIQSLLRSRSLCVCGLWFRTEIYYDSVNVTVLSLYALIIIIIIITIKVIYPTSTNANVRRNI